MLETFHWFRGEGFGLIIDDLLRLPVDTGVIAEGFRLLPHPVTPLLTEPGHAVWLLPTPQFRRAAFDSRGTAWDIARQTSDPALAQRNLLERDRMFTDRLFEDTLRGPRELRRQVDTKPGPMRLSDGRVCLPDQPSEVCCGQPCPVRY